jgi:hypothetical protein
MYEYPDRKSATIIRGNMGESAQHNLPSYAGLIGTWTESMNGASVGIHNEIQSYFFDR